MLKQNNILPQFCSEQKKLQKYSKHCYMFVWTSGFQNPPVHTDFNMFVDE